MARKATALAGLVLAACALAVPAGAPASVAGLDGSDELLVFAPPGEQNQVEVRYRTADEAGFGGISDRFVVDDTAGITPQPGIQGAFCVGLSTTKVSCDARGIGALRVALGDDNDSLIVSVGGDGVPGRIRVEAGGGDGNDLLRGGVGRDRLFGEGGNDIVAGWSGADLLSGGTGSDGLLGFTGDDTLKGGRGPDALFGQKGRDRMFGNAGIDVIVARDGIRDRVINCGRGSRQQAVLDRKDPRAKHCRTLLPKKKKK